jgi:hypothetical protein
LEKTETDNKCTFKLSRHKNNILLLQNFGDSFIAKSLRLPKNCYFGQLGECLLEENCPFYLPLGCDSLF